MKRLRDMFASLAKPVANAKLPSTKDELRREIRIRRRLSRRTTHLAIILTDYRRQDGALRR